jgi:methionine biosynthesis protein MetW
VRPDLDIVARMAGRGAGVLDLGCGDGELLETLIRDQDCQGLGVERDPEGFHACISRGVPVTQGDLEHELREIEDGAFDLAILSLTLQAVRHPHLVLEEMKRVAPRLIVSLPNFAHWRLRAGLALGGRMPVSKVLPYQWYDTPNIHLCTLKDFEALAAHLGLKLTGRVLLDERGGSAGGITRAAPNLLALGAVYSMTG